MKYWKLLLAVSVFLAACNNKPGANNKPKDSAALNRIRISVDESFRPVISEELKVFQSSYPETNVITEYKPEAECLRDMQKDSTRMVIISRELSRDETKYFD